MINRATLLLAAAVCLVALSTARAETQSYRWKIAADSASLVASDDVVYTYHYAADAGTPYFHPVRLPGGPVMTAFAPADHVWHRGLWFGWKFLNGVNYWEPDPQGQGQPAGKTAVVGTPAVDTAAGTGTVGLKLEYSSGAVMLSEDRDVVLSFPRADGSYVIDWQSTFTAGDEQVVFDRAPPIPWGGYAGLGFRAAGSMRDFRSLDSEGRLGRQQAHGKRARWMDFSGVFGEKDEKPTPGGIAIFDHPANPRHPTHWYLWDDAQLPYFSPALLFAEPLRLAAGESFTLKYRILVHPGPSDPAALEKEYAAFVK